MTQISALILAGGSGTRFWPLSRRKRPKQLLDLVGDRSLLQGTVDRLDSLIPADRIFICTTELLAEAVREQLPELPAKNVLAEPMGRNTAPAIGWAVAMMPEVIRKEAIAVLPSDHWIASADAFCQTLVTAAAALSGDRIMTLGVKPRWAETGYGYLELERALEDDLEPIKVLCFTEKPNAEKAREFVAGGRHLWNAGIFVFRGTTMLDLLSRFQPEIKAGIDRIVVEGDPDVVRETYAALPAESIDTGVMEHAEDIQTVPLEGWSDLGSWEAVYELIKSGPGGDALENVVHGEALAVDSKDNLLFSDEGTIAVIGVEGLAVIRTRDSVLVMPRERAQDVRAIVDLLKRQNDSLL